MDPSARARPPRHAMSSRGQRRSAGCRCSRNPLLSDTTNASHSCIMTQPGRTPMAPSSEPCPSHAAPLSALESLPDELLQLIVSLLPTNHLKELACVSRLTYLHATTSLWKTVNLVDSARIRLERSGPGESDVYESDEHDDTPIIQKLFILATNPFLASKVQVLVHRCHLPTPSIFLDLPRTFFHGHNLSQDVRLHHLLQLAIRNLVNVHTLRIIYGHWRLTRSLVQGFLDPSRPRCVPLRKLWLESCSLQDIEIGHLSQTSLESVRIRRLRTKEVFTPEVRVGPYPVFRFARGGRPWSLNSGTGGFYSTSIEANISPPHANFPAADELAAKAHNWDRAIWDEFPAISDYLQQEVVYIRSTIPLNPLQNPYLEVLKLSTLTITKLNLDWILWRTTDQVSDDHAQDFILELAHLRFPNLRAFQVRNAVEYHTMLPEDVYLLESTFLNFMENHPKIVCLAWPLDRFYSHARPSQDIASRCRRIVAHLSMVLTDLRLDTYYEGDGETFTDETAKTWEQQSRLRRRRFIGEFAPYMTKLTSIKLEGGIPRDEKREIIRALHQCPLEKIVLIGVSFPIGNTWGLKGEHLIELDETESNTNNNLEEEDSAALFSHYTSDVKPPANFEFVPSYGWVPGPPFLHTIACHHAKTVTELKLCGYLGSPILGHNTPITRPLLYALRHFHNLRHLVISFWLLTSFQGERRDTDIIQSWLDSRDTSSKVAVVVTPPLLSPTPLPVVAPGTMPDAPFPAARRQEFNRWGVQLKTRYAPSSLAYNVVQDLAPYLSPVAKKRGEGVRVRASFCLGVSNAHDIFDLDVKIGRGPAGDQLLEFIGPREEGEKGRWWTKLESRRWF
ncbi:hypothetical protein EJ04DRAFT_3376 [Polyplosphaeria fusca]|uniref:F-box domain-containing protein n=1 Tax=Polyplosphaeria fusca TaxID=682080 RepID=A0A9P4V663_9PLEO|nr:hypothetical protein EJ04DRAFT_3376 [Polyplosphaeria fusca]